MRPIPIAGTVPTHHPRAMKIPFRIVWSPLLVATTLVAGCDRSPTVPPVPPEPIAILEFSYSGDRSGSYRAEGEVPFDAQGNPEYGTWATALPQEDGVILVVGSQARTPPFVDLFLLGLQNITAPGTYSFDLDCTMTSTASCAVGYLGFGYDWEDSSEERQVDAEYFIESGSVTITAIDGERIQGTLQGGGVEIPIGSPGTIALSEGSFDVPVVRNALATSSNQALLRRLLGERALRP